MKKLLLVPLLLLSILYIQPNTAFAGSGMDPFDIPETDRAEDLLVFFFDLRDRESFVQVTNVLITPTPVHVQIYDVSNNCNENNFFDNYTGNDTHVYNLRDIITNDGTPSGVVLPENAYGFVAIANLDSDGEIENDEALIGNFRVIDDNGYEYRTNAQTEDGEDTEEDGIATINFNTEAGVIFSDIVGIAYDNDDPNGQIEVNILDNYAVLDVNILDINEVPLSCRNVIFSCVNQESALLESLLEEAESASVASFEYGINEAIPHSKGGELLCPNNTISEGFVTFSLLDDSEVDDFHIFVGLNNGNGRGSMDSLWLESCAEFGCFE